MAGIATSFPGYVPTLKGITPQQWNTYTFELRNATAARQHTQLDDEGHQVFISMDQAITEEKDDVPLSMRKQVYAMLREGTREKLPKHGRFFPTKDEADPDPKGVLESITLNVFPGASDFDGARNEYLKDLQKFNLILALEHTSVQGLNWRTFIEKMNDAEKTLDTYATDDAVNTDSYTTTMAFLAGIVTNGPSSWKKQLKRVQTEHKADFKKTKLTFTTVIGWLNLGLCDDSSKIGRSSGARKAAMALALAVDDSSNGDTDDDSLIEELQARQAKQARNKPQRRHDRDAGGKNGSCGWCGISTHTSSECWRNPHCTTTRPARFNKDLIGQRKVKANKTARRVNVARPEQELSLPGPKGTDLKASRARASVINMDSQCNIHLHGSKEYLIDTTSIDDIEFTGVGAVNNVSECGSILMEAIDINGNKQYLKVDEVYLTDALSGNDHLVSAIKFRREFGAKRAVYDDGELPGYKIQVPGSSKTVEFKLCEENDLLKMPGRLVPAAEAQKILERDDVTIIEQRVKTPPKKRDLDQTVAFGASLMHETTRRRGQSQATLLEIHRNLGHCSMEVAKQVAKKNKWTYIDCGQQCKECVQMTARKRPDAKKNANSKKHPHQLEADLVGTKFRKGYGGKHRVLVVVEKTTNYVEAETTIDKTPKEVASAFVEIVTQTNIRHTPGVTVLKTDRGTEFMGPEFVDMLAQNGIMHKQKPKDHPAKNGRAERMCGILMTKAKLNLADSGLPQQLANKLWPYVFKYTAMMYNCTPSKANGDVTPLELLTGDTPPYNSIASRFGTKCWVLNRDAKKTEANTLEARYLYYDLSQGFYYVYVTSTQRVQHSYDVHFVDSSVKPSTAISADLDLIAEDAGSDAESEDESNIDENDSESELEDSDGEDDDVNDDVLPPLTRLVARLAAMLSDNNRGIRDNPNYHDMDDPLMEPRVMKLLARAANMGYLGQMRVQDTDTPTIRQALNGPDAAEWMCSLETEIKSITKHATKLTPKEVEQHVRDNKTRVIPTQILCKIKRKADNSIDKRKTRAVGLGNLTKQVGDSYAPNSGPYDFRTFMAGTNTVNAKYIAFDCSVAYLNAKMEAYIICIKEIYDKDKNLIREREYYLMTRALYGLIESGNAWWKTYKNFLTKELNFTCMAMSICIYKLESKQGTIYAYVHTDDFILAYTDDQLMEDTLKKIQARFTITVDREVTQFLGMKIEVDKGTISISQTKYIDKLVETYNITQEKCTPLPHNVKYDKTQCPPPEETQSHKVKRRRQLFMELAGSLLYISMWTRPDIAPALSMLTGFTTNPAKEHYDGLLHILKYLLKTRHLKLTYGKNSDKDLIVYSDASFQSCKDTGRSRSGCVIMLDGAAIIWDSKRQSIVASSSTEAEYLALAKAMRHLQHVTELLKELGIMKEQSPPVTVYCDNQSAIKNAEGRQSTDNYHIMRRYHFVRERVESKTVSVQDLRTDRMVADIMTKPLDKKKNKIFTDIMLGQAEPLRPPQ
jgi:hypothetical protein